jgi:hypothetical protein
MMRSFLLAGCAAALACGCLDPTEVQKQADRNLKEMQVKVAEDAERQFVIALEAGQKGDACVQAGLAAAAWLQAGDKEKYAKWKEIEEKLRKSMELDSESKLEEVRKKLERKRP